MVPILPRNSYPRSVILGRQQWLGNTSTVMSLFLKFGVLLMRTVAKPVSNMVKSTVKDHETFRRLAVRGARLHARTNARWDRIVRRKPVVDKKGNPIVRRELTEDEAITLAADFIGEAFLLYSPM